MKRTEKSQMSATSDRYDTLERKLSIAANLIEYFYKISWVDSNINCEK